MASPPGLKSEKKRNKAPAVESVSLMSRNNTFVMESDRESDLSDESENYEMEGGGSRRKLLIQGSTIRRKVVEDRPAGFSTLIKRDFFNR